MRFRLVPLPLFRARGELVLLPLFQDQIPLKGEIGVFDWYLGARISRLLRERRLRGTFGEAGLLQGAGKFPVEKILVLGLGESREMVKRAESVSSLIIDRVSKLRVSRFALTVPGPRLPHRDFEPLAAATLRGLADGASPGEYPSAVEIYEPDRASFESLFSLLQSRARDPGSGVVFESLQTRSALEPAP